MYSNSFVARFFVPKNGRPAYTLCAATRIEWSVAKSSSLNVLCVVELDDDENLRNEEDS